MGRASTLASITARLGLARLYGLLAGDNLPPQSHDQVNARGATAGNLRSTIDEYVQGGASAEHAASLRDFGAKPLVVLTAGSGSAAGWAEKQNALATLSTNSVHRTIDGATHLGLVEDQENAVATSQAIHDVVSSVRSADSPAAVVPRAPLHRERRRAGRAPQRSVTVAFYRQASTNAVRCGCLAFEDAAADH